MPRHNTFVRGYYYKADAFIPERSIGYLTKRCSVMLTDLVQDAFSERGIPFTQWLVLMKLRRTAPLSIGHLARELGHDQGALTRVIDSLVEAKMVDRRRNVLDRRSVELRLTSRGTRYVESQLPIALEALNSALGVFTLEEVDQLIDLLGRLLNRLKQIKSERGSQQHAGPP